MFDILAEHIHNPPRLFYCDFEKAQINAIIKTWNNVIIAGCFFHFSQNLFKHLGMSHLKKTRLSETYLKACRHWLSFNQIKLLSLLKKL